MKEKEFWKCFEKVGAKREREERLGELVGWNRSGDFSYKSRWNYELTHGHSVCFDTFFDLYFAILFPIRKQKMSFISHPLSSTRSLIQSASKSVHFHTKKYAWKSITGSNLHKVHSEFVGPIKTHKRLNFFENHKMIFEKFEPFSR